MLAKIHGRIINVYNDQSSSSFKYKETLNDSSYKHHYILHHGNGEWQRVEPKNIMNNIIIDTDLFEYQSIMTNPSRSFPIFLDFLKKQKAEKQIITSVEMLNPENGDTPDKLFQLLLKRFHSHQNECSQEDDKNGENSNLKSMLEMNIYIWKWIEDLNSRNFSPIFYLNIIKNNSPNQWIRNFVILEIYDRLTEESNEIGSIQKELDKIAEGMPSLLPVLRDRVVTSDSCAALQPQNLLRLLKTIAKDCGQSDGITRQQWPELQQLPLSDWYYHLRSKVLEKKAISDSSNPEAVYKLLELEFENDPNLKTLLNTPIQKRVERNIDDIIKTMTEDKPKLEVRQSVAYTKMLRGMKEKVEKSKQKPFDDKPDEERIKKLISKWQTKGLNDTSFFDFLYVFDYAVQKTCTKEGDKQIFQLRDTQRVAILTLLTSKEKTTLTQVSTGEGKSLIVAGVAIAFALGRNQENKSKNVDVITSNDVLAHRDSMLLVTDGGLRNLYEYFNVSVANNCSQSVDERTQAYNAAVVYGQLANFQRDYLLDKFYDHNIRGDRTMDFVIIDEVDCMLLDRGNNTLYLSHDIPGMEMLESLYVFIWEKIRSPSFGSDKLNIRESVKSAVLYDLYGAITKGDLESIHNPLKDQPSEKNALWDHLIETKVIDPQGRLLMEDKIENIRFKQLLDPKIIFYLRNVAKRERSIRIPEHLMSFVDRHLHNWLDNAMQALELRRDEDYVVDQDRTDTSPDLNPQVIIIDQETGVDQTSSQWDGALHQFIQLKEGCKLTPQSIKAYFISNARYIKTYEKAAGVSGTLGSVTESQFMQRNYENLQFVIPTAFQRCFYLKPTQVFKSKDDWLDAIVKEARQIIQPKDQAKARSLVIFCQSIKDVKVIHQDLTNALGSERNDNHIHCYTRDYEKFAFEGKSLKIGQVIVATNLAGRGTDIKISEKLRENGGLHICLTFLPKNERIKEQAMGRSARNGAPGSGVFILYEESEKEWGAEKWFSMKEERQWREKQRISRLQKDFETMYQEQQIFDDWSKKYTKLKQELKNQRRDGQEIKTICENVLDDFSFWLDQLEDYRDQLSMGEFEIFRAEFKLPDIGEMKDTSWMTPVRSVAMAKHMITQIDTKKKKKSLITQIDKEKKKKSLSKAGEILNRVIASKDSSLYPAAHYYLAFILFEEDFEDNKDKVIQIVQTCETILNTHINRHLSFYRKVPRAAPEQTPSFCVVDAYKQQKNNMVKILEYFIGSVRALLGSHYCSASNLKEAGRDPPEKLGVVKMKMKKILTSIQKQNASHFPRFQKKGMMNLNATKLIPKKRTNSFNRWSKKSASPVSSTTFIQSLI
ncbi:protein translocase subunit SecA-like [Daphnia magna]|uniref:protein translocase subunit SecA-like n=1 Tax=Daphnia magna TaxID=35525 RepID=UPI001E1BD83C|nr:protein translocase subunit SecA-like [Daphnia magna]